MILTGIPVGIAFGFALSRGRFCMNSAFRDIIVLKDYTLLKAVGLAILVSMIGFAIMDWADVITVSPIPLYWGAAIVGGFIFGIGMVLAGGCASGITYRVGEGMVGAMSAVVGLVLFGLMTSMGVFNPMVTYLRDHTAITIDGAAPSIQNALGVEYYLLALGVAAFALLLWAVLRKKGQKAAEAEKVSLHDRIFKKGWGWVPTGIVIGLIAIAAFYASASADRMYPLAICGGYWTTAKSLIMGQNFMGWLSVMLLSTIVGAAIAALLAHEFKLRAPAPRVILQTFIGGGIMGIGAALAGGCNITHILSGVPQFALSSLLAGACIVLGCWTAAWWMFIRPMRG